MDGNVNLTGDFKTYNGYGKAVHLHDQELDFYQSYAGRTKLGTLGIIQNYQSSSYRLDMKHERDSAFSISYGYGGIYNPYILFDAYNRGATGGYPVRKADINVCTPIYFNDNMIVGHKITIGNVEISGYDGRIFFKASGYSKSFYVNVEDGTTGFAY